jgi:aspartate/methionine/tyrosine aminotransferase
MRNFASTSMFEVINQSSQLLAQYAVKASQVEFNLAIGQPELDPPEELTEKVGELICSPGYARYVPAIGDVQSRQAVADYFCKLGIKSARYSQVAIASGARSMISLVLMTLCRSNDQVFWFSPGYTYADTARILDLCPYEFETTGPDFNPDLITVMKLLSEAKSSGRLGTIIINNPINPTGRVWSLKELEALAEVITKFEVFVISDETYAGLVFPDSRFIPFASIAGMEKRTITVGSSSKNLRTPAYRLGFAHGPELFINSLAEVTANICGCPNIFALQATQFLIDSEKYVQEQLPLLSSKRQIIIDWCKIHNLKFAPLQGAFYAFVDFSSVCKDKGLLNTIKLADLLLEQGVGITPGPAFGRRYDHWARISYAGPEAKLILGLEKISSFINS